MAKVTIRHDLLAPILQELLIHNARHLILGVDYSELLLRELSHRRIID